MKNAPDMSGWLVASDIDGTLNGKLRYMPSENEKAIKDFTRRGGLFTLASGRPPESMRRHYMKVSAYPTPAIFLNGAGIYDYRSEKVLHFSPLDKNAKEIAQDIASHFKTAEIIVNTLERTYVVRPVVFGVGMALSDKMPFTVYRSISEVPAEGWGKVVFFAAPPVLRELNEYACSLQNTGCRFVIPSPVTCEMLTQEAEKGRAFVILRDMLGISPEKTGAIGDYYNDMSFKEAVKYFAVCAQAPADLRAQADYVACHCNRGAVGDFLKYLSQYSENS